MNNLIENSIPKIKELCTKYDIGKLVLFGSAANPSFNNDSEISLIVSFRNIPRCEQEDNYFEVKSELEGLFDGKINLLTERSMANPSVLNSFNHRNVVLFESEK